MQFQIPQHCTPTPHHPSIPVLQRTLPEVPSYRILEPPFLVAAAVTILPLVHAVALAIKVRLVTSVSQGLQG